ncbi:MAG: hypothetical protein R2911_29070 [Caldilineaceae bacterium]
MAAAARVDFPRLANLYAGQALSRRDDDHEAAAGIDQRWFWPRWNRGNGGPL